MPATSEYESEYVIYIGTRKLVALEGIFTDRDPKVIRCVQQRHCDGFQNGLVTNLEKAAQSIQKLMDALVRQRSSGEIAAYVVLGNAKLKSFQYESSQYFQGQNRTISAHEIRSIVGQTRSVATIPLSEFVLQAVPESFLVNDLAEIRNPIGLEAQRLGVKLNIFTMNFQDFKNISRAMEACDIRVKEYFPKTLTLSDAILSDQEKDEGAFIISIADDASHFVVWKKGALAETRVIPWGGRKLTELIAERWKIELHDAERIKELYGALDFDQSHGGELIPLVERNGQPSNMIRRQEFQESFMLQVKTWLSELISEADKVCSEIKLSHPHFILTGGGTNLHGLLEFLSREFKRTARVGLSRRLDAANELVVDPAMTPALGAYRWLANHEQEQKRFFTPNGFIEKTLTSARNWFLSYF